MQCPDALKPRSECSNSLIKVTVNARSSQTIEVFELFAVLVLKLLALLVLKYLLYSY